MAKHRTHSIEFAQSEHESDWGVPRVRALVFGPAHNHADRFRKFYWDAEN
jgi:hypothetical protein